MQKKPPKDFYKYTEMSFKMIVIILVFTFGGLKLDEYLDLSFPIATLIGALAGSGLAIYSMIRDLIK